MVQPHLKLDLAPHERQLGKYRLLAKLGEGGMGTVYLALASGFGSFRKLLVVKELRRDLPWRESSLAMFMDEAQLAARLDHPNVLQTFEAGEAEGRHFLAMEYLDGQPLSVVLERARKSGGLPIELSVHILCEVLSGLAYAHALTDFDGAGLHVVHRDVSPQNVFVTYHGQVKVVDFGVAKASNSNSLTSPGMFKGKFAYAAPEQLLGRPVDGRCDVFAVGVMLWEAMSGRRFSESAPSAPAFRTRTSGLEPRIRQLVPEADPQLAEICDRALQVEATDRFESADAMRQALEAWLVAHGGHVQPAQVGQRLRELFSEDRKLRHQVIEESMLEAGASQSVMQQLPMDEGSAGARRAAPSLSHHTPSHARIEAPATMPERPRVRTGSTTLPEAKSQTQTRPPKPRKPQAKPPWGSAAVLCALAIAVFLITYELSSSVATTTSVSAATSGGPQPPAADTVHVAARPQAPSPVSDEGPHAAMSNSEPRTLAAESGARTNAEPAPAADTTREAEPVQAATRGDDLAAPREDAPSEPAAHSLPQGAIDQPATPRLAGSPRVIFPELDARVASKKPDAGTAAVTERAARRPATGGLRGADGQGVQPPSAASKAARKAEQAASGKRQPVLRVHTDPALGSDLRELRRTAPLRNIDVEDPYQ